MAEERIDCRGLACPNPVLKTKKLVDRGDVDKLTVLADNAAAKENVSRFLGRSGFQVESEETDGFFSVTGSRPEEAACEIFVPEATGEVQQKIMVLVGNNLMRKGDDEIGEKLMVNFIGTLNTQRDGAKPLASRPLERRGETCRGGVRSCSNASGTGKRGNPHL